jgi:hypothetical protein
LVGTNNVNHTCDQVTEAIIKIVQEIRKRLAKTHIVVLEIPPRGKDINIQREKILKINRQVEEWIQNEVKNDPLLTYLVCSKRNEFINGQDGTISHTDMYDFLNFTNEGYRKFCEPLIEEIVHILASSDQN